MRRLKGYHRVFAYNSRSDFAPLQSFNPSVWNPAPEALERLVEALHPGSVIFLIRAEHAMRPDWLTSARVEPLVRRHVMGAAQSALWPLVENVWAMALRLPGEVNCPINALEVHTLHRALAEHLAAEWRAEAGAGEEEPETPLAPFHIMPVAPMSLMDDLQDNLAELNTLLDIIVNKRLHPQFQPIVTLRDGRIFGYEALIRAPKGVSLRRPGEMFRAADKARMVSWYDMACLEQCFAQAAEQQVKHLLFVNMDAEGLAMLDLQERPLAMLAREHGLTPARIVLEITERQQVGDFPSLLRDIAKLREQGFQIAIDDAGAGYSSLRSVAELRPEFVKIDRDLIRNIDVCGERRALLTALMQYARRIGAAVLTEGIETREEMAVLIEMGVPYGQGYLMGKPSDNFRGVPRETREWMQSRIQHREQMQAGGKIALADLAHRGYVLPPDAPLSEAAQRFSKDPSLTSVVVVEDECALGLIMRDQLEHVLKVTRGAQLATLLPTATVSQWMTTSVLFAETHLTLGETARQVTARNDLRLEADIIVVQNGRQYVGVVPPRSLFEAVATLQENRQRYADSLTGLPGRVPLEQALRARLKAPRLLGVIRADLTHLAAVNLQGGLTGGDEAILELARLLKEVSRQHGTPDDFLTHLGGDDFVLLTGAEEAGTICRVLIEAYKEKIPLSTGVQAETPGQDRLGDSLPPFGAPLCHLSVAALTNRRKRYADCTALMGRLYDLLQQAKSQPGSRFLLDSNS